MAEQVRGEERFLDQEGIWWVILNNMIVYSYLLFVYHIESI